VPMDGYHFSKRHMGERFQGAELERAILLRGSPPSFDAEAFVSALTQLRVSGSGRFPSFAHGTGDPVQDEIEVRKQHEVVIVEGNYLLLDIPPWDAIAPLLHVSVFIECGIEEIERRVYMRHVGNGNTPERALLRVTANDSPNALQVLACKSRAEYVV
ncbi:hypothetical protein B484DRAFT_316445, partial [Ochromonadaceae sp. CCMP2298]